MPTTGALPLPTWGEKNIFMRAESKQHKPFKLKKYVWIVFCALPLLSFFLTRPEWMARLVAVTGFLVNTTICILIYAFNPKSNFSRTQPKPGRERRWILKERILRILIILFSFCLLYFITIPECIVCLYVARYGPSALLKIEGTVVSSDFNVRTFLLEQDVQITDTRGRNRTIYAYFFGTVAKVGATYEFLVMPKTQIVLDWRTTQQ